MIMQRPCTGKATATALQRLVRHRQVPELPDASVSLSSGRAVNLEGGRLVDFPPLRVLGPSKSRPPRPRFRIADISKNGRAAGRGCRHLHRLECWCCKRERRRLRCSSSEGSSQIGGRRGSWRDVYIPPILLTKCHNDIGFHFRTQWWIRFARSSRRRKFLGTLIQDQVLNLLPPSRRKY